MRVAHTHIFHARCTTKQDLCIITSTWQRVRSPPMMFCASAQQPSTRRASCTWLLQRHHLGQDYAAKLHLLSVPVEVQLHPAAANSIHNTAQGLWHRWDALSK